MRTDWVCKNDCMVLLRLLTPANALAMELALDTGLRIGDVLALKPEQLRTNRPTVYEHKTKKRRRVYIPAPLLARLRSQSGMVWVFPGAIDPNKHRTRQAVWKDVKRASSAMRIRDNIGCHSARKVYAVDMFRREGLAAVQKALGHDNVNTTLIYLASELCKG